MEQIVAKHQMDNILALLQEKENYDKGRWRVECLVGSGSERKFFRIKQKFGCKDIPLAAFLAIMPSLSNSRGIKEARSYYRIGRHLHALDVPVPQIYGFDEITGLVLLEDLGDEHLYDVVQNSSSNNPLVIKLYHEAVEALVHLQLGGKEGFEPQFCWDTARYDNEVMLWESRYFLDAFCRKYLGIKEVEEEVHKELKCLAERSSAEPCVYLMHRDYQSKNLMVCNGKIRVIDFQGARFGPLAYDLASLLVDPYVNLDDDQQNELFSYYLSVLGKYPPIVIEKFIEGYFYLALQRNLQILGAFAFLSKKLHKMFFSQFIEPALESLRKHLDKPQGVFFPQLKALVDTCYKKHAAGDHSR